jgi:phosphotriesterase-related protein
MTMAVRTVLGDIPPDQLGVCDSHDHLFFRSRLLPGQELDDVPAAAAELTAFAELGGQTVIQWSPYGTGRRVDALAEISRQTGVHVVAATGLHQIAHTGQDVVDQVRDGLAELFVKELTEGVHDSAVSAGMIKVAGAFHGIDAHARWTMEAAAEAHHATGATIGIHHELGTAALDVVDLLCGKLGVPPESVVLGHLNRSPDPREQAEIARSGAFLAFDGPSRANHATDWHTLDSLVALAESGHLGQLLVGGDTTTAAARGGPGLPYLLRRLRPRIIEALGDDAATAIYVDNPARAFATEWRK